MAGIGALERGPVHGRPGHRDRERRLALDQDRPRVLPAEPPVGDQRLRSLLRRLPAPGRAGGRPTWSAPALPRRHRPVHALLAAGGPGAVGGFGAAAGVLLGGVLTETLSWSWIFFVNVPVGLAAFFLAPRLLDESRDTTVKSFDALGAVLVTGGLVSLVYAITQSGTNGWGSGRTIGVTAAAVALLAAFGWWERRHAEPLMRYGILRTKTVAGGNVGGLILGTATFSLFLMLTLYMQQVLGYSPMKTGVAYLAVAGSAILWSAVAAQLVNRIGVKPVLVTGMVALTSGLVYFTQVSVHGTYLSDLLPGFLLVGVGLGFSFVPISIAALAGVRPAEAGLASGLFNTTQQIGGALGIAV